MSRRRLSSVLANNFITATWKTKRMLTVKAQHNEFGWEGQWHVPTSLFGQASDECLLAVAAHLKPRVLVSGETLFQENDEGTSMFFVNRGSVSVHCDSHEMAVMEPGMYFGELGLMLNEGRMATTVACDDECEVLELSRQDFYQVRILRTLPFFARFKFARSSTHNHISRWIQLS